MSCTTTFIPAKPVCCIDDCDRNYDFQQDAHGNISARVVSGLKEINVVPQTKIFITNLNAPFADRSADQFSPDQRKKILEALEGAKNEDGSISNEVFQQEFGEFTNEGVFWLCRTVEKIFIRLKLNW